MTQSSNNGPRLGVVPPLPDRPNRSGISLRTHNILDYVMGAVLLACPNLFGLNEIPAARSVFLNLGFGLIAYSLLTQYRLAIIKLIPLRAHMTLDVLLGVSLALAPWVFGYRLSLTGFQFGLHWFLGACMALLVMSSRTRSERKIALEDREELKEAA